MRHNTGSWGFVTYNRKRDSELKNEIERYMPNVKIDVSKSSTENLMNSLGYRLEYEIPQGGDNFKQLYTWHNQDSDFFPLKFSYMVLSMIFKNGSEIVGILDEGEHGGSLYWYDSRAAINNPYIGNVYYSNIENGFTTVKDLAGLQEVLDYPNLKEQTMIVFGSPFFTGWFDSKRELLKEEQ